jgi:glycosyltransferase involved in cell wall biosynthesis
MNTIYRNDHAIAGKSGPVASIIIPAYNEGLVIRQCLELLLRDAKPGEFDVIVVCNGCSDNTEAIARKSGNSVRVFNIDQPSKSAALNLGDQVALTYPRVYMDGDLEVSTLAVRSLIKALESSIPAAIGFMEVDLSNRSWIVSSFYRLWMLHPYLRKGKFGGIYALSAQGCERRGAYPDLLGDDAFVRNAFSPDQYIAVPSCRFRIFPPCTVMDIIRVRTRVYLGNYQLRDFDSEHAFVAQSGLIGWLKIVAVLPKTWIGIPIYITLNVVAKINALRLYRRSCYQWLRDDSSRVRAH